MYVKVVLTKIVFWLRLRYVINNHRFLRMYWILISNLCGCQANLDTITIKLLVTANFTNMFHQMLCLRKRFATRFTFVTFVALMNYVVVFLQTSCLSEWFTTRFTFVTFVALMNYVDVLPQIVCARKWFTTWIRFVIFETFMNFFCVALQISWLWK